MKAKTNGYYLISNINISPNKYERFKKIAKTINLSKKANQRLEWIIYYYTKANKNAKLTCRHFDIQRSHWYYWFKRFNENNLRSLENKFKAPRNTRKKEYTYLQYERVVELRKKYIKYGKVKIRKLYQKKYKEDVSEWKVQSIIQVSGIYHNSKKQAKINQKRQRSQEKKRITELKKEPRTGYLICLDTIVKYWNGNKRYIITAIDKYSKIALAKMYSKHTSFSTRDFLYRLNYLLDNNMENIQTDNGSEFLKLFDQTCKELKFNHYFSRTKTPKDNATCERFNRTLEEEFIQLGNMTDNTKIFNQKLTEWLVEYNFNRPHQSLDYMSPIEFTQKYAKVSKMWSSSTTP